MRTPPHHPSSIELRVSIGCSARSPLGRVTRDRVTSRRPEPPAVNRRRTGPTRLPGRDLCRNLAWRSGGRRLSPAPYRPPRQFSAQAAHHAPATHDTHDGAPTPWRREHHRQETGLAFAASSLHPAANFRCLACRSSSSATSTNRNAHASSASTDSSPAVNSNTNRDACSHTRVRSASSSCSSGDIALPLSQGVGDDWCSGANVAVVVSVVEFVVASAVQPQALSRRRGHDPIVREPG